MTEKKKPTKKTAKRKKTREQFTVTMFTERGAVAMKKAYEKAGYKFIKSKITPDQVFLTFEVKE